MSQRDLLQEATRRLAEIEAAKESVPYMDQSAIPSGSWVTAIQHMDQPAIPSGSWVTAIQHMDPVDHGVPMTSNFSWLTETSYDI